MTGHSHDRNNDRSNDHSNKHGDDQDGYNHDHGVGASGTGTRTLALVSVINLVGFVVELAGGLAFGSVALLSDAVHMLFDALAYVMAFGAVYTAERYGEPGEWSFGLHRVEPSAALLNGVLLIPMALYLVYESYRRFLDPVSIDPILTAVIAAGGLLVNVLSVYILQGREMSLNEEGAFYHLLGDTGASIAVIVSMLLITFFDLRIVDPMTAVLIALLVLWSAIRVLRDSIDVLLERSPIPIAEVRATVHEIDGVESVDDLHVWQVCSQLTVASMRISDDATSLEERRAVRERIHEHLTDLGIDHATVELAEVAVDAEPVNTHTH